ncbi:RES domain-containing protein [Chitinimonas arctica]|uniref:RES domain-containing protein n=1 Tax=Chitinimonas arctica TaxID=2594795 RepID=A0A516SLI4_9NEIS|nr:RES family NAD+ phosphorylase [Chitinimonas arctica]QDQ29014.1 RES domain-containing protein [Chitinimonas arctica]
MSRQAWRIAADTPNYLADDLSGTGAKITGGRWNRAGIPLLYCAENIALACMETLVHTKASGLPLNRYLVRLEIPDPLWQAAQRLTADSAPVGWDAVPVGKASLDFGDAWANSLASAVLLVPSVIVPDEHNILINPLHPDAARISATKLRRWLYDSRLL